jgi:outer membrane protein OmpA-like peptidoglycan-associated protein
LPISAAQIESLMGGSNGLLNNITSKLGINSSTASSALGFLLPMVVGKLTPGGTVPSSFSSEVMGFVSGGASAMTKGVTSFATGAAGAATVAASKVVGTASHAVGSATNIGTGAASAATAAGGGLMKWLPWLAAGIAALFLLSYCNKGSDAAKQAADGAKSAAATAATAADSASKAAADAAAAAKAVADKAAADTADAAKATAEAAAKAVAEAVPAGSGLVGYMADGMPALKVYFDSGKTAVASEFDEKSKDIVEFLKANTGAKAIVTGYNDPTGNAAQNAELSKNRAKGVAAGLKAAGIADDRVLLEKPANATAGAALSNAEARRVEVTIRK